MESPEKRKTSMAEYEVLRVIGEGACGRAVLCTDKETGNQVVIKEIALADMSQQERDLAWKESRVLAMLSHPCIIRSYGSFVENHVLHIVMEFAEGGDLTEQIQNAKKKHFKEKQILTWFVEICLALKYIHERKILHRDIKCQNVFLTKDGRAKLGDFGIAKVLDHTTQLSQTVVGTPYYLSPELCQGKPYNSKSDMWSLGCVLYEMCTFQHAFESNCMNGLVAKILRGRPSAIPAFYSQDLKDLVDSLLQKEPTKRPSVERVLKLEFLLPYVKEVNAMKTATMEKIGMQSLPKKLEARPRIPAKKGANNGQAGGKPRSVRASGGMQLKPFNTRPTRGNEKPETKEQMLARKSAAVMEERVNQRLLREQKAEEQRLADEKTEQKRAEIQEKMKRRAEERKEKMRQLNAEASQREKRYKNLEAPFKKAKGAVVAERRASQGSSDDSRGSTGEKKKLEVKNVTMRPGKVKDREQEVNELRQMMARRRAELKKARKEAEKRDSVQIGNIEVPLAPVEEVQKPKEPIEVEEYEPEEESAQEEPEEQPAQQEQEEPPEQDEETPEENDGKPSFLDLMDMDYSDDDDVDDARKGMQALVDIAKDIFGTPSSGKRTPKHKHHIEAEDEEPERPKSSPKPVDDDEMKEDELETPRDEEQETPRDEKEETPEPEKEVEPETPKKEEQETPRADEDETSASDSHHRSHRKEKREHRRHKTRKSTSEDKPEIPQEKHKEKTEAAAKEEKKNDDFNKTRFLFAGKELHLPMVTNKDSLTYRAEAIRQFIENGIGLENFCAAYEIMTRPDGASDRRRKKRVKRVLTTSEQMEYYPLIQQLVVCEESLASPEYK